MEGGFIVEPEEQQQAAPSVASSSRNAHRPRNDLAFAQPPLPWVHGTQSNGCAKCSSLSYSQEYLSAFKVMLCNACKKNEKLISKSTAKQNYLLNDADMAKLGSVKRENPHRKDWQPMRLYLDSQVKEVASAKHGSVDGIEEKVRSLLDAKLKNKMRVREEEKRKASQDAERLERIKKKIKAEVAEVTVAGGAQVSPEDEEEI